MESLDLQGKRVLIREDLNVPIRDGIITSDKRLLAALPTIKEAHEKGAIVILLSHLGRPTEGEYKSSFSLKPVAAYLEKALQHPVRFEQDYLEGLDTAPGDIILCENVRFNVGEKDNDEALSKKLASLCDIFVMDAFGTAHREQASTVGVAAHAPIACAGPLLMTELSNLSKALKSAESPIVAIVGGAKISSKLTLLERMIEKVDTLILGGGIANTFIKARGIDIGASLYEPGLVDFAKQLIDKAADKIPAITDVVVSRQCSETAPAYNKNVSEISEDDMILDIGPNTVATFKQKVEEAKTVIWNGPLGVFEFAPFSFGTRSIALAIAESNAFTIAGGGDTLSAIDQYNIGDQLSYVSTGGGAFLTYMEGKPLPAVSILKERASSHGA